MPPNSSPAAMINPMHLSQILKNCHPASDDPSAHPATMNGTVNITTIER